MDYSGTELKPASTLEAGKTYYILTEYYEDVTGKEELVHYVIPKNVSDFSSDDGSLDYLCWYDTYNNRVYEDDGDFKLNDPPKISDNNENWVIATRRSGVRMTDLTSSMKDELLTGTDTNNNTNTATVRYMPSVTSSNFADTTIHARLGNNGRIAVETTELEVEKVLYHKDVTEEDLAKGFSFTVSFKMGTEYLTANRNIGYAKYISENDNNPTIGIVGVDSGVVTVNANG